MKPISDIKPEKGGYYEPPAFKPAAPSEKPTRRFCQEQLSRLASKKGAPTYDRNDDRDDFRLKNLLDAFEACAESEAHAIRVVDRLEESERFPDGYTLRQTAFETRTREKKADPRCTKCDSGWVQVPFSYQFGGRQIETTKAKRCDCWRDVEVSA